MDTLQEIAEGLQNGEATRVAELVQKGLDDGLEWKVILDDGLFKGMEVIGNLFREDEVFVPEVLMAAKAMEAGQKVLEPAMAGAGSGEKAGKVILGTVKGDIHNLGKNLVGVMLKGAGFEVIDIGVDVTAEKFIEVATSEKAQLIGMSDLLTTTMHHMKTNIEALQKAGLNQVKTVIGGACVTEQYANEIGADGYAENAGDAVVKVRELLGLK